MKLKEYSNKIKENISAIYISMKNKNTPILAKIFAGITIGYALSPIDLIPDFVPILGYIDDLIILPLLATIAIKLIPKDIFEESKEVSKEIWKDGKPKKWYYSIPIIIIWIILIIWIINLIKK